MDWTSNGLNLEWTQPRKGLNPDWTEPRMGLNPEWTELRMGLNPEWDSTPNGTEPRLDSTPTGTQPRMNSTPTGTQPRMRLNSEWDSTSNFYQHRTWWHNVYIYQKDGFKKRENTDQSISVKKRLSGPQHTNEFSSMLKKLETIKMFFTAVEIVPSSRLMEIWGVESRSALSPFYSMLSPILSSASRGGWAD
jgi:hypothetical protein